VGGESWSIMFAGIPFIPLDLSNHPVSDSQRARPNARSCAVPSGNELVRLFTTINNQRCPCASPGGFLHALAVQARPGAAVAAIPCGTGLRQMRMEIAYVLSAHRRPVAGQEVADFHARLLGPARARLFHEPADTQRGSE